VDLSQLSLPHQNYQVSRLLIACSRTGSIFALEKEKNFEKFNVVMSWMLSLRLEAFWSWEVEILIFF
jgi:hypothetical protein